MTDELHDSDAFWLMARHVVFNGERWAEAESECKHVVNLAGFGREPAHSVNILDLACGPGRHTIGWARQGYPVVAVDRVEGYLNHINAASTFHKFVRPPEAILTDMRRYRKKRRFHIACCLFNSLGYFPSDSDHLKVLKNMRVSLRRDGVAIVEVAGLEALVRYWDPRGWSASDDGKFVMLEETAPLDGWRRMRIKWSLLDVDNAKLHHFQIDHRLWSGSELRRLMQEAGFKNVACYGHLDGRPYDQNSIRLVVTGHA